LSPSRPQARRTRVPKALPRTSSIEEIRAVVQRWRGRGKHIALVPTMGAIHQGHLSLVRRARAAGADRVIVSIFVNPLQFGPHEDFRRYPRPIARDRRLLAKEHVDLLWEPQVSELYPENHRTRVKVRGLGEVLEGASRPGHFEGVTTVVLKLLHVVQPDEMWLGQKDAQQALILERMCLDLDLPVTVKRAPTIREPDGLACSSRNVYLSPAERAQAVALSKGLSAARAALKAGERSGRDLVARIRKAWKAYPMVREDYAVVVDARTLEPVREVKRGGRVLVAVAARVGSARLIDNFEWCAP
jgi:pantoate--beta-alanine ligase